MADPVAPSGVVPAGNPWVAADSDAGQCAVPAVTAAVAAPQMAAQGDPFAVEDLGYDF